MACDMPTTMTDVSEFRQVPDNQEVYSDVDTGATIIVELLSRQAKVSDEEAARFFFMDLATANGCDMVGDGVTLLSCAPLPPSAYPHLAQLPAGASGDSGRVCSFAALACGVQRISKFSNESGKENEVSVSLAVLRFRPKVSTDVLVSLSAPQRLHPESSDAKAVTRLLSEEERTAVLHRAVTSLSVLQWELFVPEDGD